MSTVRSEAMEKSCEESSSSSDQSRWNTSQERQDLLPRATSTTITDRWMPHILEGKDYWDISYFSAAIFLAGVWFRRVWFHGKKRSQRRQDTPAINGGTPSPKTSTTDTKQSLRLLEDAKLRKDDFLLRNSYSYGYRGTPGGYIDDWRPMELPGLLLPLSLQKEEALGEKTTMTTHNTSCSGIYLDYAGAALPTQSQLTAIYKDLSARTILANPHSTGPAASRSMIGISTTKRRILEYFDGTPGRFASTIPTPPNGATPDQCHPGYDLIFTSGATEGLRLIAERFPWKAKCDSCQRQSIFLYSRNSHTSVVGMRNSVKRSGGRFICRSLHEIESMTSSDFDLLCGESVDGPPCPICEGVDYPHLLAIPAECNFGGNRTNVKRIISNGKAAKSLWFTLVDIAKAASTGPVSLKGMDADFAVLSFYKLFGEPTGLGALMAKQTSSTLLTVDEGHYQGGGSVDVMVPGLDVCVPRSEGLTRLTHGTCHFRGIQALGHGFDELDRRGGMHRIHDHACSLARELTHRLESLRHRNGTQAVILSGAWADPTQREVAGPTVTLNILRHDGSFVGYNEVSKLALLWNPPLQFRSGCFCNPGACQEALSLTDQDVLDNFETSGHVCGDHIDLVRGRPTGAIRISFGKDSLWEDMDVFVQFLEKTFVCNDEIVETGQPQSAGPCTVRISELYLFPIKSCSGQRIRRWPLDLPSGKLRHDREFALVDSSGSAIRLQSFPKMTTIEPRIDLVTGILKISAPGMPDLNIPLDEIPDRDSISDQRPHYPVRVCGDKCGGRLWGDFEVSEWFTTYLGVQCWLARFQGDNPKPQRKTRTPDTLPPGRRVGFANEQAVLLISENAVSILNDVLEEQNQRKVGSRHFRPNVVVRSIHRENVQDADHIEDNWKSLTVRRNGLKFDTKGSCARCAMVDFDPYSGKKGKTLRALARYRRRNGQITFGVFLGASPLQEASDTYLEEGDEVLCS